MERTDSARVNVIPSAGMILGDVESLLSEITSSAWVHAAAPAALPMDQRTSVPDDDIKNRVVGTGDRVLNASFRTVSQQQVPRVARFVSEQEFEGVVLTIDVKHNTFFARLVDHTSNYPDEEVEIALDEVSSDDRSLIVPGALFSWNIGRTERSGQVQRVSELRFRRIFRFDARTVAAAKVEGQKMLAALLSDG
jgi:hypothetical protein